MKDESHPILRLLPFLKTIGMNWNHSTSAKQLLRSQPKETSEQTNLVLSNIKTSLFFFWLNFAFFKSVVSNFIAIWLNKIG